MTCVVCGQPLIAPARASRQPDRHRWCSALPGRYAPTRGGGQWVEPQPDLDDELHDITPAEIEAMFQAAKAQLRRAS